MACCMHSNNALYAAVGVLLQVTKQVSINFGHGKGKGL